LKDETISPEEKKDSILDAYHILLMGQCSKEHIKELSKHNVVSSEISIIINQLTQLSRKSGYLIDSFLLHTLIIGLQTRKYLDEHFYMTGETFSSKYFYNEIVPNMYSFCKANNVFHGYKKHLEEIYHLYGTKSSNIFTTMEHSIYNISKLKQLAIS